jgi:methyltransferase (TIGR00027 family)
MIGKTLAARHYLIACLVLPMTTPDADFDAVSNTLFITLGARATESQSADPILEDPKAMEIWLALQPQLADAASPLTRQVATGKLDRRLVVSMALRARRFDRYARDFLAVHPDGVIVNLGCGLDTRFFRIDNGRMHFVDLDLPPVIDLKRQFVTECERYRLLATSVLNEAWLDDVATLGDGPFLFLAEGLFMYLPGDAVQKLVCTLRDRFPGARLVCELFNSAWLAGWRGRMTRSKLQRSFSFDDDARFRSGVRSSQELESWCPGITVLDDWSYFDEDEPKLGALRQLGRWNLFRTIQWTVHVQLGAQQTDKVQLD